MAAMIKMILLLGILLFIRYLMQPVPQEEECQFCKEGSALIAYREMSPEDRKVARFCPICGRKLGDQTPPTSNK